MGGYEVPVGDRDVVLYGGIAILDVPEVPAKRVRLTDEGSTATLPDGVLVVIEVKVRG